MDTLGIEPRASRMLSGCDTTTPRALERISRIASTSLSQEKTETAVPYIDSVSFLGGHADIICWNCLPCRARCVVVSHPLSMREALGSIPSVSSCHEAFQF